MARLGWAGAALFTVFALLQLNDPDPVGWTLIYLVTAAYSAAAARGRLTPAPVLGWAALSAGMAVVTLGSAQPSTDAMGPGWMGSLASEGVREGLGLTLVAIWSVVLAWIVRKPSTDAPTPSAE